jgi:two-component system, OmpR family, KDP operon response regulator KdpE
LRMGLSTQGYEIIDAANGKAALEMLKLKPDLVILDLGLPDMQGLDLLAQIRAQMDSVPIVVLSSRSDEAGKVEALDRGADDYVTKPFGPQELVARVEAVLRRAVPEPGDSIVSVAGLEVDLADHIVRRDGEELHLTPTEFELLRLFVRNRARLLTHRALLIEVWGPEYADDVTVLRGQIANLRRKLEPTAGARRHYIRTEPGIGYRFDPK